MEKSDRLYEHTCLGISWEKSQVKLSLDITSVLFNFNLSRDIPSVFVEFGDVPGYVGISHQIGISQFMSGYHDLKLCLYLPTYTVITQDNWHISIIYWQTGDILLGSSKGTAAAKWQMKISRYLCQYCRYWLQNFTVTLFQLYAKDDFNGSLQWCRGFSHCKIIAAKISHCILPQSQWVWLTQRNKMLLSSI